MTLIRYNQPNRDLFSKRFSDVMDEFFDDMVNAKTDTFVPGIDISETDDQFEVAVQLPGMEKEDIDVSLDNGRLTISGERTLQDEEKGKKYHRVETNYGSFSRSFQLPDSIDPDSINAKYENGMLNITIDKSEEKVKKQIEIT